MDPTAVREELAERLATISDLNTHAFPPGSILPDAAVLQPQNIKYHQVYDNGASRMALALVLITGRLHDQSAHQRLDEYAADAGARSIREVLESGTYTAFDEVTVGEGEWDGVTFNSIDYLACIFMLDIFGPGG